VLGRPSNGKALVDRGWPQRYAARRIAWHALDHVWEIEPARLDEARRWLDHIEGQWDEALGRLKASLERET